VREIELKSQDETVELPDKLNVYQIKDVMNELSMNVDKNEISNFGDVLFKVAEMALDKTNVKIGDLEWTEITEIAEPYWEQIRKFQGQ